jgi:hypothetical protein
MFTSMGAAQPLILLNDNPWQRFTWYARLNFWTRNWIQLVYLNGGTLRYNEDILLADWLANQLTGPSWASQLIYLLPFIGNNIKAAICPLIDRQGIGIPSNIGPFVDADCGNAKGLKGDGLSKLLNIGVLPYWINAGNVGLIYCERNFNATGSTTEVFFSSNVTTASSDGRFGIRLDGSSEFFSWGAVTNRATTAVSAGNHRYITERSASNSRILYRDGTSVATNTTTDTAPTALLSATPLMLLGAQDAGSTQMTFNKGTCGAAGITLGGLGSTNIAALDAILSAFITTTGR